MAETEREENAKRILSQLEAGVPFDRIFPPRQAVTPAPEREFLADFAATDIPSPHGGTVIRSYVLDCPHGKVELSLADHPESRDGEVLGTMLSTLRSNAAAAGVLCLCWPRGWAAA